MTAAGLVCAGLAFTLGQVASDASAAESATLDQCANGGVGGPIVACTGGQWQNGNLGQASSQYTENSSVPFRIVFGDLTIGGTNTVVIEWDTTHSADKHTYDYLTTYDQTEAGADPCSGVTDCNTWAVDTFAIPVDPNIPADPNWAGTQTPGSLTMFGGTITGVSAYSLSAPYSAGGSSTQITITFTSEVATPVMAWAGHVASQDSWGAGHAAADIPGSPYHMRLLDLNGSGGNQDRSLSVSTPLGGIRVVQDTVPDDAQDFGFTVSGPGLFSDSFDLDDDGEATISDTRTFTDVANGTYTITQETVAGWALTDITCTDGDPVVDLSARSVTITVNEDFPNCTFTNEQRGTITIIQDTVPDSGKDFGFTQTFLGSDFTLDDDADGTLSSSETFVVPAGTYSVTQAVVAGFPLTSLQCVTTFGSGATTLTDVDARTASVTLTDASSVECTFTNTKESSTLVVTKTAAADPVESLRPATFDLDIQNTAALDITVTSLVDSVFGEIAPTTDASITSTTCALPQTIAPAASYTCSFTAVIQDAVGSTHDNTVTASGTDEDGDPVTADGPESVGVVAPVWDTEISIIEDAVPDGARDFGFTVTGPGGGSSFTLDDDADGTLSNTATDTALDPGEYTFTQDEVTAWPLTDLVCTGGSTTTDLANRSVTITIADGDSVSCTFTNTKTASTIAVTKTISPDPVPEGGAATFQVMVENTSEIDVSITSLIDDVYGDVADGANPLLSVTACVVPQDLGPSETYSCAFAATITGTAGTTHTDTVTASGTDEDGDPVTADGPASVEVVEPVYIADVMVEKTVDPASAQTGTVVKFTIKVTNLGPDQAQDVVLHEVIPTGLLPVSAGVSAGSYDETAHTWDLGTMTMGQDETLSVEATVTDNAENTATVSTTSTDPQPENNVSGAGVTVTAATPTAASLPFTGLSGTMLLGGLAAVVLGGGMLLGSRRRRPVRR